MADAAKIAKLEKQWQDACAAKRALFEELKGNKSDPKYQAALAKTNAAWKELQEARGVNKTPPPPAEKPAPATK